LEKSALQVFPEGGYYVLASDRGGKTKIVVAFDAGPRGLPGHHGFSGVQGNPLCGDVLSFQRTMPVPEIAPESFTAANSNKRVVIRLDSRFEAS
jgi:hypothetical protein